MRGLTKVVHVILKASGAVGTVIIILAAVLAVLIVCEPYVVRYMQWLQSLVN